MAVTEIVRALGSWSLTLSDRTPQHVVDLLDANRFGHIAVDAARDNPEVLGDELLRTARYVGVLRGSSHEAGKTSLSGSGMAFWLGAEDGLGDGFETAVPFVDVPFDTVIAGLLPPGGGVTAGSITAPAGAVPYKGTHRYETPRHAIDYVCDLYACDWRVNGDATLDAGPPEDLYVTDPQAAVIRRAVGVDMDLRALPGAAKLDSDVEDFSTRVVTLAEGEGTAIAVGTANIAVNPYVDLHGNPIRLTRFVSESNTSATNADARAQLVLQQFTNPRTSLSLSTDTHDIRGDLQVGDSVWLYDPDAGLVDTNNEIVFRGDRISPVKLRVFQVSWPVEPGMGVYFRTATGVWVDLTDYVEFEAGSATNLTVGGYDRTLNQQGEAIGFRPNITNPDADASTPGVPVWTPPFNERIEIGEGGLSRASVLLTWDGPATNTDATAYVDGALYDIRWRPAIDYQPLWSDFTGITWGDLAGAPWGALASGGAVPGEGDAEWTYNAAPADTHVFLLDGLTPGRAYEIQVRAVDAASPPHAGGWAESYFVLVGRDSIAPDPPAAPIVAASPVQVSVKHTLGLGTGGTFNLPLDLAGLIVHIGESETFEPDDTTRAGRIVATRAQINARIPVIGTFPIANPADQVWVKVIAEDTSGNQSLPSAASAVTVKLIDSEWVRDLTADNITSGTFTASYGLVGLFTAGTPGSARFEAGDNGALNGFRLYRPSGALALHGDATTGDLRLYGTDGVTATLQFLAATGMIDMRGRFTAGSSFTSGDRVVIDPDFVQPGGGEFPSALFYSAAGAFGPGRINASDQVSGTTALGLNSGPTTATATYEQSTLFLFPQSARLSVNAGDGISYRGGVLEVFKTFARIAYAPANTLQSMVTTDSSGAYLSGSNTSGTEVSRLTAGSNGDITTSVPVGTTGAGFSQKLQNGAGAGVRGVWAGDHMAFVDNQSGGTWVPLGDGQNPYSTKSFVIPHPLDGDRWLVHGCTESPYSGVEYWGEATIVDGSVEVPLPSYFEALTVAENRQVQVTMIDTGQVRLLNQPTPPRPLNTYWVDPPPVVYEVPLPPIPVAASVPRDGLFTITCPGPDGTRVAWLVKAVRKNASFDVEPLRSSVRVGGSGPYRFLTPLSPPLESAA